MCDDAEMEEVQGDFDETYGYLFRDRSALFTALTDPSFLGSAQCRKGRAHNRRYEIVGDAVIRLALREHLFVTRPYFEVSDIEPVVAKWVSNVVLAEVAASMGLDGFLSARTLDSVAFGTEFSVRQLACVLEAVLGAIHFDGGYDVVRAFVEEWIVPRLPAQTQQDETSPKTILQHRIHRDDQKDPNYVEESAEGIGPERRVVVAVYAGLEFLGRGEGISRNEASLAAASDALARLE